MSCGPTPSVSPTIRNAGSGDAPGHIHDRKPVVVPPMHDDWLDPTLTDPDGVRDMLDAVPEPRLQPYEVSTAVNNIRNNTAALLHPV